MSLMAMVARPLRVAERNVIFYRRYGTFGFVLGVVEPLLYLLGIGFGMGRLVGEVELDGRAVAYAAFVAPAMMASAAMNGSLFETTFNLFYKLKVVRSYDAVLATPLTLGDIVIGEILFAVARGAVYSSFFLVALFVLDLVSSPLAVLALPASLLVSWVFAAIGATITTWVRAWTDFDVVSVLIQPIFLASATFFPVSVYPDWARPLVAISPLYHGAALMRSLALGTPDLDDLGHVAFLVVVAAGFSALAARRISTLLVD